MISPRIYFTSLLAVHIDSAAIVADIAVIIALELFTLLLVFVLYYGRITFKPWSIGEFHAFKTCTCFRADFVTIMAASPNITSDHCDILCCLLSAHVLFLDNLMVHMVGHS